MLYAARRLNQQRPKLDAQFAVALYVPETSKSIVIHGGVDHGEVEQLCAAVI